MRVLVVSDTHGGTRPLAALREQAGAVDWLLHAGDCLADVPAVAAIFAVPSDRCLAVAGNSDYPTREPAEALLELSGVRIWVTHGHRFHVQQDPDGLLLPAQERGARVAVFGHSHLPLAREAAGVLLFNPGSPGYSRRPDRVGSCGVLELDGGRVQARHLWLPPGG